MAWLTGWQYRKKITIDETKVDANLTDFPVLVKLTSSNFDFTKALSNGNDIRFTSSDGQTLLKYERERHDATNEVAEYWVKIPSVSGSVNTDFYIYFGNVSASDGADPTNVWDANFKGVWHMKDLTTSTVKDSTNSGYDGTKRLANNPLEVDGKIAKGQDYERDNQDYIYKSNVTPVTNAWTLECWVKFETIGSIFHILVVIAPTSGTVNLCQIAKEDDPVKFSIRVRNSSGSYIKLYTGATTPSINTWYYVVGTWDGTNAKIFLNGEEDTPYTRYHDTSGTQTNTTREIYLGNDLSHISGLDGILDEVRISNVARSADWIKASYYSGNDTLVSYGIEEALAAGRSQGFIF
jgi:hypothetical protein